MYGREPYYPSSIVDLGHSAYVGCPAVVFGLSSHPSGARPEIEPILVALGLHTVLTGAAESLPMRCGGIVACGY